MPLEGLDSLDQLRSQQVNADSGAAIGDDVADLTAAFKKHAKGQHDQAVSDENDAGNEVKGHMDAFNQGKGDVQKMQDSIDRYQKMRMRRKFYSDFLNDEGDHPAIRGGVDVPEGPSVPGSLPGPDTQQTPSFSNYA